MGLIPTPQEVQAQNIKVLPYNGGAAPSNTQPVIQPGVKTPAPVSNATPTPPTVTPTPPTSNFSSSAMPTITQTANAATSAAATSMNTPTSYTYKNAQGQTIQVSDPVLNRTQLYAGGYTQLVSGPNGNTDPLAQYVSQYNLDGTPKSTVGIPAAQAATLNQQNPGVVIQNTDGSYGLNVTLAKQLGFLDQNGNVTDQGVQAGMGQAKGQPPSFNSASSLNDPNSYVAQATTALSSQLTATLGQNTSSYQLAVQNETTQYNQQKDELNTQMNDAISAEMASMYATDPNLTADSPMIQATKNKIREKFQPSFDQLESSHSMNLATLLDTYNTNNTNAHNSYSQSYQSILSGAASLSEDMQKTSMTLKQQATSDFMNYASKFNLDLTTPQGLAGASALITQAQTAGIPADQAWALLQSGTIANNKQDQSAWLANLKNFTLPDMSGMSLTDAMKDPMIGSLIAQGANLFPNLSSQDDKNKAAFESIKSSYQQQKDNLDLQKEQASIQKTQADTSAEATRLGLETERLNLQERTQAINSAAKLQGDLLKPGTPGQLLVAASGYMPSIEAAVAQGGKGASALTLLDALVKLDTGGTQAVRQGQVDVLLDSGTLSDTVSRLIGKLNIDNKTGYNTILQPAQVQQIYSVAKQIMKEKIDAGSDAFYAYKNGVDSIANGAGGQYATDVYGASPNLQSTLYAIQKYGGSSSNSTAQEGDTKNWNGQTWKVVNGNWVQQ